MARRGQLDDSKLRPGWTTGACATAAATAAYEALLTGEFPDPVEVELPLGRRPSIALTLEQECARADHVAHRERGTSERRFGSFLGLSAPSAELRSHHPRDLSVGQRRLLVIAIQLSHTPRALLIDEPSRGLDPSAAQAVRRALLATAKSGTAVLLATHDPAFAAMADRRLLLADGVLRAEVPA